MYDADDDDDGDDVKGNVTKNVNYLTAVKTACEEADGGLLFDRGRTICSLMPSVLTTGCEAGSTSDLLWLLQLQCPAATDDNSA